jgi:hypothetical protein
LPQSPVPVWTSIASATASNTPLPTEAP